MKHQYHKRTNDHWHFIITLKRILNSVLNTPSVLMVNNESGRVNNWNLRAFDLYSIANVTVTIILTKTSSTPPNSSQEQPRPTRNQPCTFRNYRIKLDLYTCSWQLYETFCWTNCFEQQQIHRVGSRSENEPLLSVFFEIPFRFFINSGNITIFLFVFECGLKPLWLSDSIGYESFDWFRVRIGLISRVHLIWEFKLGFGLSLHKTVYKPESMC